VTGAGRPTPSTGARTIGPEPAGATPIDEEDLAGLIPDFVATRADLNQVEFENISRALPWAHRRARASGVEGVLSYAFLIELHRRMFGDVWRWAGRLRRRVTNIGVVPAQIATQTASALADARFWHQEAVFDTDELAARIQGRLVAVHPFPNGNGRSTRLMADLYLVAIDAPVFSWGRSRLDEEDAGRAAYISALVAAVETDDYAELVRFARG